MKIHILGGAGSGKTFLSSKFEDKYGISPLNLDDIVFDNSDIAFKIKRPEEERNKLLSDFIKTQNEDYIIEGVYYDWLDESFEKADYIFLFEIPLYIRVLRVIRRWYRNLFDKSVKHKIGLISTIKLIKWMFEYYKEEFPLILKKLEKYQDKVTMIKSKEDVRKVIYIVAQNARKNAQLSEVSWETKS